MNEAIVSTGIYYYDEENITQGSLAFRRAVGPPCTDSGDTRGAIEVFGIPEYVNACWVPPSSSRGSDLDGRESHRHLDDGEPVGSIAPVSHALTC